MMTKGGIFYVAPGGISYVGAGGKFFMLAPGGGVSHLSSEKFTILMWG